MEVHLHVMESFTDQIVSAASSAQIALSSLHPIASVKRSLPLVIAYMKKYWIWLLYFVVMRKLYRLLFGRRRRSKRGKKIGGDDGDSSVYSSSSGTVNTDRASLAPYFSATSQASPGTNQVIVGDGVILVNRNDRYVEVYERRDVARVDNVDDQVESLLSEFAARNRR